MIKPTTEEWYNRLEELIKRGSYYYKEDPSEEVEQLTFKQYQRKVNSLTEKAKNNIEGIGNRGWDTYHIDHKISISYGFKNKIDPIKIADISNLRMLDKKTNCDKGTAVFIDEENEWIIKKEQ